MPQKVLVNPRSQLRLAFLFVKFVLVLGIRGTQLLGLAYDLVVIANKLQYNSIGLLRYS